MASIAYSVFFIALVLKTGESLKCYDCYSENDANCGKDFKPDKVKKVECTRDTLPALEKPIFSQLAIKEPIFSCVVRGGTDHIKSYMIRSCTIAKSLEANPCKKELSMAQLANISGSTCFICEKDLCNGNGAIASSLIFVTFCCLANIFSKYVFY